MKICSPFSNAVLDCTAPVSVIGFRGTNLRPPTLINPPPTAQDWADIGKLPDWSGVWNPKITDQDAQVKTNPPPWNERPKRKLSRCFEEKAGRPRLIFPGCLPEAHPTWMLITHNAMEVLFTPGRVTMLGESDGNRLRRIYTDGRKHPEFRIRRSTAIQSVIGKARRSSSTRSTSLRKCRLRSARPREYPTTAICAWSNGSTSRTRTSCTSISKFSRGRF